MCSGTQRKVKDVIVLDLVVEREIEVITPVDESAVVKRIVVQVEVGVETGIEILLVDVNEAKAVKGIGILLVTLTEAEARNVIGREMRSSQVGARSAITNTLPKIIFIIHVPYLND